MCYEWRKIDGGVESEVFEITVPVSCKREGSYSTSTTVSRRKGFYKYYLPTRRYLINELKIYWDGWHFEFVPTWNPDIKKNRVICGESLFERLKKYIFPIIFDLYVENSIEETVIGILVGDGEMNRM